MPTDDLCNYIENKAANDSAGAAGMYPVQMPPGHRMHSTNAKQIAAAAASSSSNQKSKSRAGQAMSIEDQQRGAPGI